MSEAPHAIERALKDGQAGDGRTLDLLSKSLKAVFEAEDREDALVHGF